MIYHFYGSFNLKSEKVQGRKILAIKIISFKILTFCSITFPLFFNPYMRILSQTSYFCLL